MKIFLGSLDISFGILFLILPIIFIEFARQRDFIKASLLLFLGIFLILTSETFKEYSWDKPRGEIGEKPILVTDDECSFRNGLRFKSTDRQDDRWYAWRNQNWGTKWDCYCVEIDECDLPNGFEVTFDTAWSPPEEICQALREQYPDICISWFFDEPGMEVAGYL